MIFRADASLQIGTGHVMRCLALADGLRAHGANCRFLCREHPGNLIDLICRRGHEVRALPADGAIAAAPPYAAWLGTDWATDAAQSKAGAGDTLPDWLIVDHYALDADWERALRPSCRHLMVIDDLADRPHDCDLLLDQNLGRQATDYAGLITGGCEVLAGPEYALLRPEFATLRPHSIARRARPALRRLLIGMGGVDKDNASGKVLDALNGCPLPADCCITVVLGAHAPWLAQTRDRAARMPWPTEVLVDVENMAWLLAESDVAIGAAGTSAWERCCLGVPTLTMALAANQQAGAAALEAAGCALPLPGYDLARELRDGISRLLSPEAMQTMQNACAATTAGDGVDRLTNILLHVDD